MPKNDFFLTWFQGAAIPTQAKHKAAARLYLNWMLSEEFQASWVQFPSRYDIEASASHESVLHHNTSPGDFHRFNMRRSQVERFRSQIEQLVGPMEGPDPSKMDYEVRP